MLFGPHNRSSPNGFFPKWQLTPSTSRAVPKWLNPIEPAIERLGKSLSEELVGSLQMPENIVNYYSLPSAPGVVPAVQISVGDMKRGAI